MDGKATAMREAGRNMTDHMSAMIVAPNAKKFYLVCKTANELFNAAVPIFLSPRVLPDLLSACQWLKKLHCQVIHFMAERESILGEDAPRAYAEEYAVFKANVGTLDEEREVLEFRIRYLLELLEGCVAGREPMSHEELMNFMDTLAPTVNPDERKPNPIDEPSGTTVEVPDDAAEAMSQPATDPPGGFGEAGPYYDPASPLSKDQISEALNPSRFRANAEEVEYEGHDESELAELDDQNEVRGTD